MDAEYPCFVQRILEVVYPDFHTQKPTVAIVSIDPIQHYHADILYQLKRGQILHSLPIKEYQISCPLTVCQTIEVMPLRLEKAQYTEVLSYLSNFEKIIA